jgi:hypothetical protein
MLPLRHPYLIKKIVNFTTKNNFFLRKYGGRTDGGGDVDYGAKWNDNKKTWSSFTVSILSAQ